jgi:hypothetical protein
MKETSYSSLVASVALVIGLLTGYSLGNESIDSPKPLEQRRSGIVTDQEFASIIGDQYEKQALSWRDRDIAFQDSTSLRTMLGNGLFTYDSNIDLALEQQMTGQVAYTRMLSRNIAGEPSSFSAGDPGACGMIDVLLTQMDVEEPYGHISESEFGKYLSSLAPWSVESVAKKFLPDSSGSTRVDD